MRQKATCNGFILVVFPAGLGWAFEIYVPEERTQKASGSSPTEEGAKKLAMNAARLQGAALAHVQTTEQVVWHPVVGHG